ncbi:hypothetical protein DXG01_015461 [Tephrocybe rancida]|nr:hypothetical protein DXG01_015461 [Tephrocybe rancida]
MDLLSPSNTALLKKVEKSASLTNQHLLSDVEIVHAKAILLGAENERARLDKQILKLRIALAPHKRIPREILEQIFLALYPGGCNDTAALPTASIDLPWALGQVCSAWRTLSRSMPSLWGCTYIDLSNWDTISDLKRAIELLPKVSLISLKVSESSKSTTLSIIPYLPHLYELDWKFVNVPEEGVWDVLPKHALSQIVSAKFSFPSHQWTSFITESTEMFGTTPRLQNMRLYGNSPNVLLLSDFPWTTITSLTIYTINCSPDHNSWLQPKSLWMGLARRQPFYLPTQLQSFTLDIAQGALPLFLSLNPPWDQLTEFSASSYSELHLKEIMQVLQQCTALTHFVLDVQGSALGGEPVVPQLNGIILSQLQNFHMLSFDKFIFPECKTPALTTLKIDTETEIDVWTIVRHIARSECRMESFSVACYPGFMQFDRLNLDPLGLIKLLASIPHCVYLDIHSTVLPESILSDIASGALLPELQSLFIRTSSLNVFLVMVEHRLKMELGKGQIHLDSADNFRACRRTIRLILRSIAATVAGYQDEIQRELPMDWTRIVNGIQDICATAIRCLIVIVT